MALADQTTDSFDPILKHLLGFPIPVIAAINGHAFAAGFMLAMACDYRVMKSQKAWLSMNEILFGGPIPHSFGLLFNAKCTDSTVVRKVSTLPCALPLAEVAIRSSRKHIGSQRPKRLMPSL